MRMLAFSALVAAACNLGLTLFVLTRGLSGATNRAYALWGAAVALWNVSTFFLFQYHDGERAVFWAHMLQVGVIFLPAANLQVCCQIARVSAPKLTRATHVCTALFLLSLATGSYISGVRSLGYASYAIAGWGFWLFSVYYAVVVTSTLWLLQRHKDPRPSLQRARTTMLTAATCLLIIFGTHDFLPILGVEQYPWTDRPVYPLGNLAAIFYGLIVGYSALQHQLLGVHVAFGKVAAHVIRFGFLFLIGLALQLALAAAAPAEITTFAFTSSLAVLLISTMVASLLFPRLFGGHGLESLERRLLGDQFEYQDQVRNFIRRITSYVDLDDLLDDLHALLAHTFGFASYRLILRDETGRAFSSVRTYPAAPLREMPGLTPHSPIFQYFRTRRGEYLAEHGGPLLGNSTVARQAREQLARLGAQVCFPLMWHEEPLGMLLVGTRASGNICTATDIALLAALTENLSMVVNQIRLKDRILLVEEMDLLGRMSRGMAHDLNNLLTPVSTLLQLREETGRFDDELLPVAARNVSTIRAYIRESLFFSENLRPDLQPCRLDPLVRHAAEVARNSRPKKKVEVIPVIRDAVSAELDAVLIQRLLANLVTNAIDASPSGSQVIIKLEQLAKTDERRDWFRLSVIDRGEGIAPENLDNVLTPYFTTKNRGDDTRGFGLGLAICRKIATLHGGNLSIESRLKKGTTVRLDLPTRPLPLDVSTAVHPSPA